MEYYFEVYVDGWKGNTVLVKAKNVIEAGKKAAEVLSDEIMWFDEACISKIEMTLINRVID